MVNKLLFKSIYRVTSIFRENLYALCWQWKYILIELNCFGLFLKCLCFLSNRLGNLILDHCSNLSITLSIKQLHHTPFCLNNLIIGCERTLSDNACVRVVSNYPFAKLMEIAESVPTGRVLATKATSDKILNFYNFTRAL